MVSRDVRVKRLFFISYFIAKSPIRQLNKKCSHRLNPWQSFLEMGFFKRIDMPVGSWIDAGMFIQNILLASQELGLATCPQAAFAEYPDVIRETLNLDKVDIICGITMGNYFGSARKRELYGRNS